MGSSHHLHLCHIHLQSEIQYFHPTKQQTKTKKKILRLLMVNVGAVMAVHARLGMGMGMNEVMTVGIGRFDNDLYG
jgi:hypothetical protein